MDANPEQIFDALRQHLEGDLYWGTRSSCALRHAAPRLTAPHCAVPCCAERVVPRRAVHACMRGMAFVCTFVCVFVRAHASVRACAHAGVHVR